MATHVSIIICTRNRAESLRDTLSHLSAVDIPADWSVELLLVDNASTDQTAHVFQSAQLPGFSLKYIREERLGKSFGLNRALNESTGEILLWTDDDVHVPTRWLVEMCSPITDGRADAIAGAITFPTHIERVLIKEPFASRRGWFAAHDYLSSENPQAMIGANMAFHRRVLTKVPGFDVELGPGTLGFCDDSLFAQQLKAAGFRLQANFNCAVEHHFDIRRATPDGLIKTARGMGRSYAFVYYHWEHNQYSFAFARLAYARIRLIAVRIVDQVKTPNISGVSDRRLRLEQTVAFCREYLCQSKRKHKYAYRGLSALEARPQG